MEVRVRRRNVPRVQLTLDDYEELERLLNCSWHEIDPIRSTAKSAKTVAAYMYSKRMNVNFADMLTKAGQVSALEFVRNLSLVDMGDESADPTDGQE